MGGRELLGAMDIMKWWVGQRMGLKVAGSLTVEDKKLR